MTAKEKGATKRLEVVKWMVNEDLPLSKFQSMISLLKELKTPDIDMSEEECPSYELRWSTNEFLKALSTVAEEDVSQELQKFSYVTVLADESTDIAVNKRLIIYAQVTDQV